MERCMCTLNSVDNMCITTKPMSVSCTCWYSHNMYTLAKCRVNVHKQLGSDRGNRKLMVPVVSPKKGRANLHPFLAGLYSLYMGIISFWKWSALPPKSQDIDKQLGSNVQLPKMAARSCIPGSRNNGEDFNFAIWQSTNNCQYFVCDVHVHVSISCAVYIQTTRETTCVQTVN